MSRIQLKIFQHIDIYNQENRANCQGEKNANLKMELSDKNLKAVIISMLHKGQGKHI